MPIAFWQNSTGLSADVIKRMSITVYYIWQPELQIKHAQTKHIVGLSLNFELKPGAGNQKDKKLNVIPEF
ncbi:hypothetical protein GCM10028809_25070 [Spirosoma gilvum]